MQMREVSTPAEIETVVKLANAIWYEWYSSIIGEEQVAYMLENFQSYTAVEQQIKNGFFYYLVYDGEKAVGYTSIAYREAQLFLSKIYILSEYRGRGIASFMLGELEHLAKAALKQVIFLTVNKQNLLAIKFYEAKGFKTVEEVVTDIGGGFVMDDYVMEKELL